MFFQVKVTAKPLATNVTSERLLLVMRVHVERQIIDLVECFVTYITLVLLLGTMGQFVIFIITFLVKAFAAEFAHVRFVAGVDAHVSVQCGRAVERLSASVTFVRLFVRVDDFVPTQRAGLSESFAADFADEGTRAGVHGHMTG